MNQQTDDAWGTRELTTVSEVRGICSLASLTGDALPKASSLLPALLNTGTGESAGSRCRVRLPLEGGGRREVGGSQEGTPGTFWGAKSIYTLIQVVGTQV